MKPKPARLNISLKHHILHQRRVFVNGILFSPGLCLFKLVIVHGSTAKFNFIGPWWWSSG